MWKRVAAFALFAAALLAAPASPAAELTATETRWLEGVWPVVLFARAEGLALDIVVQPQATPGAAPLARGFVDGRCKLVLSMRGNPQAEATLARIPAELLDAALELMAAHELGHCRRYLDGAWHGVPAGFSGRVPDGLSAEQRAAYVDMKAARREEGYGDLVGLAWTRQRHPQRYEQLHAWLLAERGQDLVQGSHHDTLRWVTLAREGSAFDANPLFGGAAALWRLGIALDN